MRCSVQSIELALLSAIVLCTSSCIAYPRLSPQLASNESGISNAKSLLQQLGLEMGTEVLRCFEPSLLKLAQTYGVPDNRNNDSFETVKESIYLRAEVDLAATDGYHSEVSNCSNDAVWAEIDNIRMRNAAFLNEHLTVDFVERLGPDFNTLGSIDVIARHYTRDLPGGGNAAENLESIYAELLPTGRVDPFSYAGIADAIAIRKSGMQVYGSYVACEGDRWRYDPPIADEKTLDLRRSAIMGERQWSDPPEDMCIQ